MEWILLYFAAAILAYWIQYSEAVDYRGRVDELGVDYASFWMCMISFNRNVRKLWILDYVKIHCPWSWKTSVYYRVQEAHRLLRFHSHEKGWTAEDCHDPTNHEQIARDCFQSRTRFWMTGLVTALISPITLVLSAVIQTVLMIVMIIAGICHAARSAFSK